MDNYFDSIAEEFSAKYLLKESFIERKHIFSRECKLILNGMINDNVKCLDLGCGPGVLSIELARNGCDVVGVDQSSEMIEIANRMKAGSGSLQENHCLFFCDDAYNFLCRQKEKYDLIVISSVLEYIKSPENIIDKVSCISNENGFVLVSVPNRRSVFRWVEPMVQNILPSNIKYLEQWGNNYSSGLYEDLFYKHKFSLINEIYLGMPNIFYKLIRNTNRYYVGTMKLLVFNKAS